MFQASSPTYDSDWRIRHILKISMHLLFNSAATSSLNAKKPPQRSPAMVCACYRHSNRLKKILTQRLQDALIWRWIISAVALRMIWLSPPWTCWHIGDGHCANLHRYAILGVHRTAADPSIVV